MKTRIFILFFVLIALTGCQKDKERTSIMGSWNCEEYGEALDPRVYQVNITRNNYLPNETDEFIINNFNQRGFTEADEVYVTFDESAMTITINGSARVGLYISGTGEVADDYSTISWEYYISDGAISNQNYVATYY